MATKSKIALAFSDREKERRESDKWFEEFRARGRQQMEAFAAAGFNVQQFMNGRENSEVMLGISPRSYQEYSAAKERLQAESYTAETRRKATQLLHWKFHQHGSTLQIELRGDITEHAAVVVGERLVPGLRRVELTIDHSDGGLVEETRAIIAALQKSGAELHTHAIGRCESAAVLLFAAGTRRTCDPRCEFLIHDCHCIGGNDGSLDDLRSRERIDAAMAESLAAAMTVDAESIRSLMSRTTRFDARAAELEGLAHQVVDRQAEADKLRLKFEAMKQREARRLLKRREELARRPVNSFGTLRNVEREYANDWVKMPDGRWHFDTDPLAKVRPKEESQRVGRCPERAQREYLASLDPEARQEFIGHLQACGAYFGS